MKMNEILQPSCDLFSAKLHFFSITENWENYDLSEEESKLLTTSFKVFKNTYCNHYYHTLFHLLSCSFCVDRSQILRRRSHPELWRLAEEHPGQFIHTVKKVYRQKELTSQYFCLLYEKLVIPHKCSVLFYWKTLAHNEYQIGERRAAGATDGLPPNMDIPKKFIEGKDMSIHFQWDPITHELNMELCGGSAKLRIAVEVHIFYLDGEQQIFLGKDIAIGGSWSIPADKAANICRLDFIYKPAGSLK